jgi:probable F420-dependent oxidoreductase
MRPFRFTIQLSKPASGGGPGWRDLARKVEDLGYSTLYVPDHFDDQWAPMLALTVAAEATTSLRVGPLVLDNDYRHPVVLAKEAATLDVLSDGRLELGIGAGWMRSDYDQSGIAFDPPAVRIDRLVESLEIMTSMWRTGTATHNGTHYNVTNAMGTPTPTRSTGVPLLIGGGSPRVLGVAALYAEIVSIVPSLAAGYIGPEVAAEATAEKFHRRVQWVKDKAGDRFSEIELQNWTASVQVVDNGAEMTAQMARLFSMSEEELAESPLVLIGSIGEIIETLERRRDEYGFTNICVHEAELEAFAPVVAKLAGS